MTDPVCDDQTTECEACPHCGAVLVPGCSCDCCGWPDDIDDDDDDDDQSKILSFFQFMENPAREFDRDLGMSIFADEEEDAS